MRDLSDPKWMYLKASLLLLILLCSAALLLADEPSWRTAGLLALLVWASARVYYFMFYVIERYIDPSYRFSGVLSALRHLLRADLDLGARRVNVRGPRPEDTIAGLGRTLALHPNLRVVETATTIEVPAPSEHGFSVSLHASAFSYTVHFEGWHEHFDSPEEALRCFAFAFSGRCRLAISYRGTTPVKWVLEQLRDGQWHAESETGLLLVPFWRRVRVEHRQNSSLALGAP
jgi:hypothetical protein